MENRLDKLKIIKKKLNSNKYISKADLESDIENLINVFWYSDTYLMNDNLYDIDLGDMSSFHIDLIDKVSEIHRLEINSVNESLIETSVDMKWVSDKAIDSKTAYKIYTFNKRRDYIFVGDLHSDDYSLKRVISDSDFFESVIRKSERVLIFDGDYVDRGKSHLKIMERILIMKYLFPERIFLLRGNHDGGEILEDGTIKLPYRIPKDDDDNMYFPKYLETLTKKNKSTSEFLLIKYLEFFNTLSYIAIVNLNDKVIMGVHGGIPRPDNESVDHYGYIKSLKDLTDETIVDELGRTMCQNIMWSDPYREGEYREKTGRYHYKQEHVDSFMKKFKLELIIRGHEEAETGYWYALEKKVITIFSSGSLDDSNENKGNKDNKESWYTKINPKILKIDSDGNREFL